MAQKWADIRDKRRNMTPEHVDTLQIEARAELLELELRELRELAGKTQIALAEAAGMTQPQLSRFESGEDRLLSTLRRYVKALGGELEVVAVLGDHRVTLRSV